MDIHITPRPLSGQVAVPPSKSAAHRLLICAALADNPSTLLLNSTNDDIQATIRCLNALGAQITSFSNKLEVHPLRRATHPIRPLLDCGESGSTLRFLLPVTAALGGGILTVCGRLPLRPLSPLREALEEHGCTLSPPNIWPLEVFGKLVPGHYRLAGNISSQYFSGLLLALPLLPSESFLEFIPPLESAPYIQMTLAFQAQFGIKIYPEETGWRIPSNQRYTAPSCSIVEGDWSGAAFWLAAGALTGPITLTGLNQNSVQGDRTMMDLIQKAGAALICKKNTFTIRRDRLLPLEIDASEIPDLVPPLSALAALTPGTTHIYGATRLRDKESDRLAALTHSLGALGAIISQHHDSLIITGQKHLAGGTADGWNDHRIVMALAVAALGCQAPVTIRGSEAVAKSYPHFFDDYNSLGGNANVIHHRQ